MGGHKYFVTGDAKVTWPRKNRLLYGMKLIVSVRLLGSIVGDLRNRQWQ